MRHAWESFLSVLFPENCIACGKSGAVLCAICERSIVMKPTALGKSTAALFDYKNPLVKKAVWALKYDRRLALAEYFGTALYREFFKHLGRASAGSESILLIPIPSSAGTIKERGSNHAEAIARVVAENAANDELSLSVDAGILLKEKETLHQVELKNRAGRQKNLRGAFTVTGGEKIAKKTIILIDDVVTTGATLREARAALRKYGPKKILAIAVAH